MPSSAILRRPCNSCNISRSKALTVASSPSIGQPSGWSLEDGRLQMVEHDVVGCVARLAPSSCSTTWRSRSISSAVRRSGLVRMSAIMSSASGTSSFRMRGVERGLLAAGISVEHPAHSLDLLGRWRGRCGVVVPLNAICSSMWDTPIWLWQFRCGCRCSPKCPRLRFQAPGIGSLKRPSSHWKGWIFPRSYRQSREDEPL